MEPGRAHTVPRSPYADLKTAIGVNRSIHIVLPAETMSQTPVGNLPRWHQQESQGSHLFDQCDTSSWVCLTQDMRPVTCVNIVGHQLARHRPTPKA